MPETNQRKFPRSSHPCYLTLWLGDKFDTLSTQTVNISAAGVLVNLDQPVIINSKLDLKIEFLEGVHFECCGTIVRCLKISETPAQYGVAISFEALDEAKVAFLKNLVETLFSFEKSL